MYVALSEHFVQVGLTSTLLYMSLNEKKFILMPNISSLSFKATSAFVHYNTLMCSDCTEDLG